VEGVGGHAGEAGGLGLQDGEEGAGGHFRLRFYFALRATVGCVGPSVKRRLGTICTWTSP
jgi:hypothetical protein